MTLSNISVIYFLMIFISLGCAEKRNGQAVLGPWGEREFINAESYQNIPENWHVEVFEGEISSEQHEGGYEIHLSYSRNEIQQYSYQHALHPINLEDSVSLIKEVTLYFFDNNINRGILKFEKVNRKGELLSSKQGEIQIEYEDTLVVQNYGCVYSKLISDLNFHAFDARDLYEEVRNKGANK